MADDISPVTLPPIASTGDAPPHDSRGSTDRNKKKKEPDQPKGESAGESTDTAGPQPKARDNKSPSPNVDFEWTEHELDRFA